MKKLIYLGMASMLAACGQQLSTGQFKLDGSIAGMDGQQIILQSYEADSIVFADTVTIENGTFAFKGELKEPFIPSVLFIGDIKDYEHVKYWNIYLEPKEMTVSIDTANIQEAVITGSTSQAEWDSLMAIVKQRYAETDLLEEAMSSETDAEKAKAIEKQIADCEKKYQQQEVDFMKSHPNSYVVPEFLGSAMGYMALEDIESVYDNLGEQVKAHCDLTEIEHELAVLKRIAPGAPAPDFATIDVNGDSIRFSEVAKGKYVLLDFWASWCKPCRASMPHVKALYDKYHEKGFEVFCVSDNDSSPEKWRDAIKQDGIEKFYHVLRGLRIIDEERLKFDKSKDISELYAIHFLPTKYLIDKDFKIVGKLSDEELDDKLKEAFGE